MGRPIRFKSFFALSVSSILSGSAKPPLSPPFDRRSWVSDFRSVPVGFSRFKGGLGQDWSRSTRLGGRALLFGTDPLALPGFSVPLQSSPSGCCAAFRTPSAHRQRGTCELRASLPLHPRLNLLGRGRCTASSMIVSFHRQGMLLKPASLSTRAHWCRQAD